MFASGRRAACVAAALLLVSAYAAEQKQSLIGATREQVLARYGEPRSVIVAGGREVMFFARERVVIRNGVVVEVEPLAAEPAPRRPAASAATAPAAAPTSTPAVAPAPTEGTAPTAKAGTQPAAGTATTAAPANAPAAASPQTTAPAAEPSPAAARPEAAPVREPEIAIKSVRPPSGTYVRVPPPRKTEPVVTAPAETAPTTSAPAVPPSTPAPAVTEPPAPAVESRLSTPPRPVADQPAPPSAATTSVTTSPAVTVTPTPAASPATTAGVADAPNVPSEQPEPTPADTGKKAAPKKRGTADVGAPGENIFTGSTYLIALVVIVIGAGFLFWRRRQRQLELDATAVSRDPFISGVAATVGSAERFTAEHLAKLDWKHFEELVAAYYEKTGVVAERTKAGPDSPVHIKISWKGESRPFALVQCIARPQGLVEVSPLQELLTVLTAEDIRRGYVVTTGKFTVAARDFAEEKHLTLMPGEIFLEKLNALPDSARNEVMQVVMSGDVTTPTCPKCDAKMVRSPDDPTSWHCPTHPDVTQPVVR